MKASNISLRISAVAISVLAVTICLTIAPTPVIGATGSGELSVGQTIEGALSDESAFLMDGTPYETWRVSGTAGETIAINMRSPHFDTYLIVQDTASRVLGENDDYGDSTDARVVTTIPSNGQLVVLANALEWNPGTAARDYELQVEAISDEEPTGDHVAGRLQSDGPTVSALHRNLSRLSDGTYYEVWEFVGEPGSSASVRMRSTEIDAYLLVVASQGHIVAENDDLGPETTDAQVLFTVPDSGRLLIYANSFGEGETGQYELITTRHPAVAFGGPGDPDDKFALVVGVATYPNPQDNLPFVEKDVELFVDLLETDLGFKSENIVVLQDMQATRNNIVRGFLEHLAKAGPGGTAVFYYSGHGTRLDENVGIQPPLDPEGNMVDEALYVYDGLMIDDEIGILLGRLTAGNVMVTFDSCHAGHGTRTADGGFLSKMVEYKTLSDEVRNTKSYVGMKTPKSAAAIMPQGLALDFTYYANSKYVFLSASDAEELSWGDPHELQASFFTYFLVDHFKKLMKDNPDISFSALMERVSRDTEQAVSMSTGAIQTPRVEGRQSDASIGSFFGNK